MKQLHRDHAHHFMTGRKCTSAVIIHRCSTPTDMVSVYRRARGGFYVFRAVRTGTTTKKTLWVFSDLHRASLLFMRLSGLDNALRRYR